MKRHLTITGSYFLILGAAWFTMGTLLSAFSFGADIWSLLPVFAITTLALAILVARWRGKGLLILAPVVLVLLIWRLAEVAAGMRWVAFHITSEYSKWLHVPILFPGAEASSIEATLFFGFVGIVLIFLLFISVCLKRSTLLTVLFTVPFVFLTVVLIESRPNDLFFIGLMVVYATMLIGNSMHQDNPLKSGRGVTAAFAVSVILLLTAYLFTPPGSYRRGGVIDGIDSYLRNTAERLGLEMQKKGVGWPNAASDGWRFDTEFVAISDAGQRIIMNHSILEITATRAGTFYLKGYSLQSFNGRDWRMGSDSQARPDELLSNAMPALLADAYGTLHPETAPVRASMSIARTGDNSDMLYQPYFSVPIRQTDDDPYTVDYYYYTGDSVFDIFETRSPYLHLYNEYMRDQPIYTQIEGSTAEGLRRLALDAGINPQASRMEIADAVADFVSSAARYTHNPHVIPEGEDFALYFLQTSKQGYCIHFATAATLMLRAMDIPARFTSGFAVTVFSNEIGRAVVVTDRDAHAWVEVYYEDIGWIPLEVTPAHYGSGPGAGRGGFSVGYGEAVSGDPGDSYYGEDDYYDFYDVDHLIWPDTLGVQSGYRGRQNTAWQGVAIALVVVAACVAILVLRRMVIRKYRKGRFAQPDTNAAVIYAWRYIHRMRRQHEPPEGIEDTALKARFSQHRITEEERAAVIGSASEYSAAVYRQRSLPGRLWQKYVRAL